MVVDRHGQDVHRCVSPAYRFCRPCSRHPGILAIFVWRILAKFIMHRILPPTFRFLGGLMTLPHRRYYTPATDYKHVPPEKGLHPIPSVLDLPGMLELEVDGVSTARTRSGRGDLKQRSTWGGRSEKAVLGAHEGLGVGLEELGGKDVEVVKHYDADGEWRLCGGCRARADRAALLQCSRRYLCIAGLASWRRA